MSCGCIQPSERCLYPHHGRLQYCGEREQRIEIAEDGMREEEVIEASNWVTRLPDLGSKPKSRCIPEMWGGRSKTLPGFRCSDSDPSHMHEPPPPDRSKVGIWQFKGASSTAVFMRDDDYFDLSHSFGESKRKSTHGSPRIFRRLTPEARIPRLIRSDGSRWRGGTRVCEHDASEDLWIILYNSSELRNCPLIYMQLMVKTHNYYVTISLLRRT